MAYSNRTLNLETVYIPTKITAGPANNLQQSRIYTVKKTTSGQSVPDWKSKVSRGDSAASPYSCEVTTLKLGKPILFRAPFVRKGAPYDSMYLAMDGYNHSMSNPEVMSHVPVNTLSAEAAALSKLYKKLQREFQHLNSPAVLAEFLDVIRQFGKPAEAIVDLTNRRLNRLALAQRGLSGSTAFKKVRYAEVVASTWLEYAFGLAPLIEDTRKAAEALARWEHEDSEEVLRLRAKAVSRAGSTAPYIGSAAFSYSPIASVGHLTMDKALTEYKVQYTVGLRGQIIADYGSNQRLLQLLGFDPKNWIPAAWEAVPWSWLVDYFSNVQQILDAASTNTGRVGWISKAVTYRTKREVRSTVNVAKIQQYYESIGYGLTGPIRLEGDGTMTFTKVSFVRSVPASLGVPPLVFEHPFGDVKKLANMVAVLIPKRNNSALWFS